MKLLPPNYRYIAYIDESGDEGLNRIRPMHPQGASEWLILSAVVISAQREHEPLELVKNMMTTFKNHQKPDIHFTDLNPAKKRAACSMLAAQPLRLFAVASNKKNMEGYRNRKAERVPSRNWFYCWMLRLLLERVTHFVAFDSIKRYGKYEKVKIEYSEKGGQSYSQMRAYYKWLKNRPLYLNQGPIYWETMHEELQEVHNHKDRAGLQLADIVAGAFYKACDKYHTGQCDPDFAKLLEPRMARSDGLISGYGLKLMPSLTKANLLEEQEEIFKFYGYPKQWWAPASSDSQSVSSASKGQASW